MFGLIRQQSQAFVPRCFSLRQTSIMLGRLYQARVRASIRVIADNCRLANKLSANCNRRNYSAKVLLEVTLSGRACQVPRSQHSTIKGHAVLFRSVGCLNDTAYLINLAMAHGMKGVTAARSVAQGYASPLVLFSLRSKLTHFRLPSRSTNSLQFLRKKRTRSSGLPSTVQRG